MPYSQRDFRDAFCRALAHRPTRALWLAALRQQVTYSGPPVPIEAPEDLAEVLAVEAQLPTSEAILQALVARLHQDMPEWFQRRRNPDAVVALHLMTLVLGYQARKFPDPLRPLVRRGQPPHTPRARQARIEMVVQAIRTWDKIRQAEPEFLDLLEFLPETFDDKPDRHKPREPDLKSRIRAIQRLGYSLDALKAMARADPEKK